MVEASNAFEQESLRIGHFVDFLGTSLKGDVI